jgi:hypothetical protein
MVGETLTYFLPSYFDEDETDTHSETIQEIDTTSLPSFITLSSSEFSIDIEPTTYD